MRDKERELISVRDDRNVLKLVTVLNILISFILSLCHIYIYQNITI